MIKKKKQKKSTTNIFSLWMKQWKASPRSGFTMIELLMVIALVAIIGAVALPSFLDFRDEGRVASVQEFLRNMRTAIKLREKEAILRCGKDANFHFSTFKIATNLVLHSGDADFSDCLRSSAPNGQSLTFLTDSKPLPNNPFANASQYGGVLGVNITPPYNQCASVTTSATNAYHGSINLNDIWPSWSDTSSETPSWIYNTADGNIWANSRQPTNGTLLCSL
ncbi:MAG: type II secretion system protein [Bdellovibrionota bacterium]